MDQIKALLADPKQRLYLAASFGCIVLIALIASVYFFNNKAPEEPNLTEEEEMEILGDVIDNNSPVLIDLPLTQKPNPDQPAQLPTTPNPSVKPDLSKYNYRVTKTTYNEGPAVEACRPFQHGMDYGASRVAYQEAYEFFTTTSSYYKTTNLDSDRDLYDYSLSTFGSNKHESIYYAGGDYSVKFEYNPYANFSSKGYQENSQLTTSYPGGGSLKDYIKLYFGDNAEIVAVYKQGGQKYYEIQSKYKSPCDAYNPYLYVPGEDPVSERNLLNIYKVNADNFEIVETRLYLENLGSENLIYTRASVVEKSMVSESTVINEFKFPYNVSQKVFDYKNYQYSAEKQAEKVKTYLETLDSTLLYPSDEYWLLSYVNSSNIPSDFPGSDYYTDRKFYPSNVKGDQRYQAIANADQYIEHEMYLYFHNRNNYDGNYQSMNVYIYNPSVTSAQLINELISVKATQISVSDINIKIEGQNVNAKYIRRTYEYRYPLASYAVSYPQYHNYSYTDEWYVLELNGQAYRINSTRGIEDYKTLETTNDLDMEFLNEVIFNSYKYPYYQYPASYPASYPISYFTN